MRRNLSALILLPACLVGASLWAKPVNPFARPAMSRAEPANPQVADVVARAELRGLILAGPASIANLNGMPLAIGESHAGYELMSVSEESATFSHGEESITLFLEEDAAERNE